MADPIIEIRDLRRGFAAGGEEIVVLKDVDLTIERGELIAIIGQSGNWLKRVCTRPASSSPGNSHN